MLAPPYIRRSEPGVRATRCKPLASRQAYAGVARATGHAGPALSHSAWLVFAVALAGGCSHQSEVVDAAQPRLALAKAGQPEAPPPGAATSGGTGAGSLPAPSSVAPEGTPVRDGPEQRHGLSWYEDAPDRALSAARAAGKPVLVDLWAPWCHTCLSMQNFVLTAENLPSLGDRFVLLAIDTEREENAEFLRSLPVTVWPTFYVVSPDPLRVAGRWLGAASPAQFARFLDEAERVVELRQHAAGAQDPLRDALLEADELATRGHFGEAARAYAKALSVAPRGWPRRPETLVAQMTALWKANAIEACLALAQSSLSETGNAASTVDFAAYALECAAEAPKDDARALGTARSVVQRLDSLCHAGSPEFSPDDRADACDKLAGAYGALGDVAAARRATLERLAILERAALGKPDEVAITYDWARTDSLLSLDRAEEAVALSRARERALPQNYNPPTYQARAYKQLGRWSDGLAAVERALALAYGPRRIGLYTLKTDLLIGAGRVDEALDVLRQQLALYRALPEGQRQPAAEGRVTKRLDELAKAHASAGTTP